MKLHSALLGWLSVNQANATAALFGLHSLQKKSGQCSFFNQAKATAAFFGLCSFEEKSGQCRL